MTPRRRSLSSLVLIALLLLSLPTAGAAAAAHRRTAAQRQSVERAIRRARGELGGLPLPAGTYRIDSLPGEPDLFEPEPRLFDSRTVESHRAWIVPRDPHQVFRWIERRSAWRFRQRDHFDSGFFDESGGDFFGEGAAREGVGPRIAWRRSGRGVRGSSLSLEADRLAPGENVVKATTRVGWVDPRPRAERIPDGVARITVTKTTWRGVTSPPVRVSRGRVTGIARIANRLRIYQGDGIEGRLVPELDPEAPRPPVVHVQFESRAGVVLAEASQRAGTDRDVAMRFVVRGRRMAPLQNGARLLRAV